MGKSKCTPLEITATLVDGRVNSTDGVIMFDSILYHAWFLKYAPHVLEGQGDENWSGHIGLPLKRLPGNRWAASRGIYTEIGKTVEYVNKRPDFFAADKITYLSTDKGIISDSMGVHRAYRIPSVIRTVKDSKIVFYAIGHRDKIEELLNLIPAVGKKYSAGWGMVRSWAIRDIEADYTTFHPEHGLMRPVLVDETSEVLDYPIMQYGVKPPYWKIKNRQLCYVPISGGV